MSIQTSKPPSVRIAELRAELARTRERLRVVLAHVEDLRKLKQQNECGRQDVGETQPRPATAEPGQ